MTRRFSRNTCPQCQEEYFITSDRSRDIEKATAPRVCDSMEFGKELRVIITLCSCGYGKTYKIPVKKRYDGKYVYELEENHESADTRTAEDAGRQASVVDQA